MSGSRTGSVERSASAPSRTCTRREARAATVSSCVTMMSVSPSLLSSARKSRIAAELLESRFPVGSSHSSRLGEPINARAIATLCCWPPESFFGRKSARFDNPTRPMAANARSRRPRAGRLHTSANITFSSTVRYGRRWNDWKTNPMRWLRTPARCPSVREVVSTPSSR